MCSETRKQLAGTDQPGMIKVLATKKRGFSSSHTVLISCWMNGTALAQISAEVALLDSAQ